MSFEEAVAYATDHLASVDYRRGVSLNGLWQPSLRQKYGVIDHGGVNPENRSSSDIWFEISDANAEKLVLDSREKAEVWDLARSICVNNLLRERAIPKPLRNFVISVLIEEWPRPQASETYNNSKRDRVLCMIIFEVWVLFDLSENKSCQAVRVAAQKTGFYPPESLVDVWRKGHEKQSRLPERTEAFKEFVRLKSSERLKKFRALKALETTP